MRTHEPIDDDDEKEDTIPDETSGMSVSFEDSLRARGHEEHRWVRSKAQQLTRKMRKLNSGGTSINAEPDSGNALERQEHLWGEKEVDRHGTTSEKGKGLGY